MAQPRPLMATKVACILLFTYLSFINARTGPSVALPAGEIEFDIESPLVSIAAASVPAKIPVQSAPGNETANVAAIAPVLAGHEGHGTHHDTKELKQQKHGHSRKKDEGTHDGKDVSGEDSSATGSSNGDQTAGSGGHRRGAHKHGSSNSAPRSSPPYPVSGDTDDTPSHKKFGGKGANAGGKKISHKPKQQEPNYGSDVAVELMSDASPDSPAPTADSSNEQVDSVAQLNTVNAGTGAGAGADSNASVTGDAGDYEDEHVQQPGQAKNSSKSHQTNQGKVTEGREQQKDPAAQNNQGGITSSQHVVLMSEGQQQQQQSARGSASNAAESTQPGGNQQADTLTNESPFEIEGGELQEGAGQLAAKAVEDDDSDADDAEQTEQKKHAHTSKKGTKSGFDKTASDSSGHKKHRKSHSRAGHVVSSDGSDDSSFNTKAGKGRKHKSSSNQPRYPQVPADDSDSSGENAISTTGQDADSNIPPYGVVSSDSPAANSQNHLAPHEKHHNKKHDRHQKRAKSEGEAMDAGRRGHSATIQAFKHKKHGGHVDTPVPQPPSEVINAFVGAGTFNWRALATQTAAEMVNGLGESPYFPTLRGPRRKASAGAVSSVGVGVTSASYQLMVNSATADRGTGFFGTSDRDMEALPSDEALLVGPVEGSEAHRDRKYVIHAVNRVAEIFLAYGNGTQITSDLGLTRISLQNLMSVTSIESVTSLVASEPTGYFDLHNKRYVLVWLATAPAQDAEPLIFVAVSQSSDPLGQWVVKGLRIKPSAVSFKCGHTNSAAEQPFFANYPQVTYTAEGVYISVGLVCNSKGGSAQASMAANFRSAIYAISKPSLYSGSTSGSSQVLSAALYIVAKAWFRSVSISSSVVVGDTLNNFAQPVKPQTLEDVFNGPYFVQKVDDAYMSVATIGGGSLTGMTSLEAAPRLSAGVFARFSNGLSFSNGAEYEGLNAMSQPETDIQLFAGDTGMVGRNFAVRSYGAVLYEGSIYLTTSEFYGAGSNRVPSIYYAIVEPGSLSTGAITVHGSGVIASKDGLMLGFPVIAALSSGDGAIIAYSYARSGDVNGVGPGYPGVATTTVRNYGRSGSFAIDIVKLGEGSITMPPVHDFLQRWGDYSAVDIVDNKMWFAVPTTRLVGGHDPLVDASYASWISVRSL